MLHTLTTSTAGTGMPAVVRTWLPPHAILALDGIGGRWEELHLRVGRCCSVTVGGENRRVALSLRPEEMEALLVRLCDGSLYAHRDSINQGYISLEGGIRVGVCGHACLDDEDGVLLGVRDIDALCIRFPRTIRAVGGRLIPHLRAVFPRGALIYAPPGVGKTTLLRALAHHFAGGERALRVAVVDSRCELNDGGFLGDLCVSLLSGYPKGRGIEIAARSMNAQVILCDEIGNTGEAEAVLAAANCGVPVIATAHAATLSQLLARPGFSRLHRAAVFGTYVGLQRQGAEVDFAYEMTSWEAVRWHGA